jgi:heme-degrading monooxygenase HmoA
MIVAASKIKVADGTEDVAMALLSQHHLVGHVPGFLGMETFVGESPTEFYSVTRWTDLESFESWRQSPTYMLFHEGLQLDPGKTEVKVLTRLTKTNGHQEIEESVVDAAPFLARYLATSESVHYLAVDASGLIVACSQAVLSTFDVTLDDLLGSSVWCRLFDQDAHWLQERVASGLQNQESALLNFVDGECRRYTLLTKLDVYPDGFVLVGELPQARRATTEEAIFDLNNQLAVITREHSRQNKALKKALAELEKTHQALNRSNWHLKKIQEVLPICMQCGKVDSGEASWQDVVQYLKENSDFLSHGYCPECFAKIWDQIGLEQ